MSNRTTRLMSEGQWFSCAPAVREQSLSSLAHPHSSMAPFCLAAPISPTDSRNVRSHQRQHSGVYAGHAASLYRVIGACNVAETIGWPSFIFSSRLLAALLLRLAGPAGTTWPASCRLNVATANQMPPPSTPNAPRFRDARVTCSTRRRLRPARLSLAACAFVLDC
jgi:hypothetical protein